jgi:hypothetical protein
MENYKNLSLEDLPNEEWRDVVGYEGLYQISNLGRVKSLHRKMKRGSGIWVKPVKIMQPPINGNGYHQVTLYDVNGKGKIKGVHQLVAEAFIKNIHKYMCIDHINTIKTDNRIENLRWCDYKMNMNNPITKAYVNAKRITYCFEDWYREKQRYHQPHSKRVLQFNLDNSFVKEWRTISEAARAVGTSVQAISRCCNGIVNTSMGFIWKFNQ